MRLWEHQRADVGSYHDDSVLRIHRVAFWCWWWIWGVFVRPARVLPPPVDTAGAEIAYMRRNGNIWPPNDDYSMVYAKHHYAKPEHWAAIKAKRERKKSAKTNK